MESPKLPSAKKSDEPAIVDAASLSSSRSADATAPATIVDDEGKLSYTARSTGLFSGPNIDARKQRYRLDAVALDLVKPTEKGELGGKEAGVDVQEDNTGLHRTLGWKGCSFHMGAYAIALGVLSIPKVVATIGWGTFILLSLVFGLLTWYTGMAYYKLQQR